MIILCLNFEKPLAVYAATDHFRDTAAMFSTSAYRFLKTKRAHPGLVVPPLISALERQRQPNLCESEASVIFIVSFKTLVAI